MDETATADDLEVSLNAALNAAQRAVDSLATRVRAVTTNRERFDSELTRTRLVTSRTEACTLLGRARDVLKSASDDNTSARANFDALQLRFKEISSDIDRLVSSSLHSHRHKRIIGSTAGNDNGYNDDDDDADVGYDNADVELGISNGNGNSGSLYQDADAQESMPLLRQTQQLQTAQRQRDNRQLAYNAQLVTERHEAVRRIEGDVGMIHQVFLQIGRLVSDQGHVIDHIETHMDNAVENTEGAADELQQATNHARGHRRCQLRIALLIFVLCLILATIIVVRLYLRSHNHAPN